MKKIIIVIIALSVTVASSLYVENMLTKKSSNLIEDIKIITQLIEKEEWESVDPKFLDLENKWEEVSDGLGIIVEHSLLEKATISLKKSHVYCTFREKQEALAEMKEFEYLVDHIPRGQTIQSKNIL